METTTRNVMDIPANDRQALERLLGMPLELQQRVMIFTYTPGQLPEDETREVARRQIVKLIATNQQLPANAAITPEEAVAAIEEALSHIRPRS